MCVHISIRSKKGSGNLDSRQNLKKDMKKQKITKLKRLKTWYRNGNLGK